MTFVQTNSRPSRCRGASQPCICLHFGFVIFAPVFQRQKKLLSLLSGNKHHDFCDMLFFCCFEQNHIFLWSGNQEAVTLSKAYKELAVFKSFCRFVKTFDFDAFAVTVYDFFWVIKMAKDEFAFMSEDCGRSLDSITS